MVTGLGVLLCFIVFLNARWVKSEKNIKGSGIPQVEAELKGLMSLSWWSVLWKKFVLGILAISSGLDVGSRRTKYSARRYER